MTFPLAGEGVALDLANTVVRHRDQEVDLLAADDQQRAWLAAHAGVLPAGMPAGADLLALRDAARVVLRACAERRAPAGGSVEILNEAMRRAPVGLASTDELVAWPDQASPAEHLLAALAFAVVSTVLDSDAPVRACANPDCLLLFRATSSRRQFCSTAVCSNRTRQARHRAHSRPT